jgi:hypothetical protein
MRRPSELLRRELGQRARLWEKLVGRGLVARETDADPHELTVLADVGAPASASKRAFDPWIASVPTSASRTFAICVGFSSVHDRGFFAAVAGVTLMTANKERDQSIRQDATHGTLLPRRTQPEPATPGLVAIIDPPHDAGKPPRHQWHGRVQTVHKTG